MPIYEYACEECHAKEEILQKFGEETPEVCPNCHAQGTLKKTVTSSAFHLKGGGWYKDLYSSSKKSDTTSSSSSSSSESGSTKTKKGDD